jgi:hypothetical protein
MIGGGCFGLRAGHLLYFYCTVALRYGSCAVPTRLLYRAVQVEVQAQVQFAVGAITLVLPYSRLLALATVEPYR